MHTNALIEEKSPYLRQHAHNPVDWMPWGERAFEKARAEGKPIFLSIGYSTCHWCHVMAHESFESGSVADVLNRDFVPIKIDREERPDVDRIYMLYVQAVSGSGGWPMSVWLTPDLKPFYGGTYFPPDSRYGRPGFRDICEQLAKAWRQDRGKVEESGSRIVGQLKDYISSTKAGSEPDAAILHSAFQQFRRMFDATYGGFGGAPKFPRPVTLNFLLRYYATEQNTEALEMVTETLHAMAAGGMHDHLGGGFHRYSVDQFWFVPHFEKMLYDQAQLAISYVEAYGITQAAEFAKTARDIFDYVLRDLTDVEGGFYSAEDADSPDPENAAHSGEGAFYIWRQEEIERILGQENATKFVEAFGVRPGGNVDEDPHGEFTGRNILFAATAGAESDSVEDDKRILLEARARRPRPHLDRKILTAWNGLMISALAKGAVLLNERTYLEAAERAARFLLMRMRDGRSGQLLRRYCDDEAAVPAFLDDYAFLAQALLDLFEATFDPDYLATACDLARRGMAGFEDPEQGGFFSTAESAPDLLLRMKDDYDGAEPSGNSVAIDVLLRLAHLTGDEKFQQQAERGLRWFAPKLKTQPVTAPQALVALDRWLASSEQIVIRVERASARIEELARNLRAKFAPHRLVMVLTDESAARLKETAPFFGGLERKGRATLYRCHNHTCELPEILED